jgi:hypothetical protein
MDNVFDIQTGDVVLINNTSKTDWFSAAQHIVTGMPYTHTALGLNPVAGYGSLFEADLIVGTRPFNRVYLNTQYEFEQYRPVGYTQTYLDDSLHTLFNDYAENEYGFGQIPWLAWIKLMAKFGVDLRKAKSWFPGGTICTQLVWHHLDTLGDLNPALKIKVNEWNDNNCCASDIAEIVHAFTPSVFKLINQYKKPK